MTLHQSRFVLFPALSPQFELAVFGLLAKRNPPHHQGDKVGLGGVLLGAEPTCRGAWQWKQAPEGRSVG